MLTYYSRPSAGEDFQEVSTPHTHGMWVAGSKVTATELHTVEKTYDLDGNILGDVLDVHELPRIEARRDELYVFLRTPERTRQGNVITRPLLLVSKGTVFLSLSQAMYDEHHPVIAKVPAQDHTEHLLLATFATVIGQYEEIMQKTADYIKELRKRLRSHEVTNQDLIQFVTVEDNLNEYHMNLSGMMAVAERLRNGVLQPSEHEALDDIVLHIRQLLSAGESYGQSITSIRNAYTTIANNTLNQRMKTLTVFTVLIALPNVFYGMYGMNIALPFADAPWAYTMIVGFTIFLISTVYILAKRLKVF